MQNVETHNITLTDSMMFNVTEMKTKLQHYFGEDFEPNFRIEHDANEYEVKILGQFYKKDFIAHAKDKDFVQALHTAEKKFARLLLDEKDKHH